EKALHPLLPVKNHVVGCRRVLAGNDATVAVVGTIHHTPELSMRDVLKLALTYFPHQQRAEWPASDQRVNEKRHLVRRPDEGSLEVRYQNCSAVIRSGAVQQLVKSFGFLLVDVSHYRVPFFAASRAAS